MIFFFLYYNKFELFLITSIAVQEPKMNNTVEAIITLIALLFICVIFSIVFMTGVL